MELPDDAILKETELLAIFMSHLLMKQLDSKLLNNAPPVYVEKGLKVFSGNARIHSKSCETLFTVQEFLLPCEMSNC